MATSALYACTKCNQRYPFEELSQGQQLCKVPLCVWDPVWLQARKNKQITRGHILCLMRAMARLSLCNRHLSDPVLNASNLAVRVIFDESKRLCCETKDDYTSITPVVQQHEFGRGRRCCEWVITCMPTCCFLLLFPP